MRVVWVCWEHFFAGWAKRCGQNGSSLNDEMMDLPASISRVPWFVAGQTNGLIFRLSPAEAPINHRLSEPACFYMRESECVAVLKGVAQWQIVAQNEHGLATFAFLACVQERWIVRRVAAIAKYFQLLICGWTCALICFSQDSSLTCQPSNLRLKAWGELKSD